MGFVQDLDLAAVVAKAFLPTFTSVGC